MVIRKTLHVILLLLTAFCAVSCSHDNPPFEELGGTRWNGTNIGTGVLIDIQFGQIGTYDVSMTFYQDPRPYEERGQKIDTTGNRQFGMKGHYIPSEIKTDKGKIVSGYKWKVHLTKDDGTTYGGVINYDHQIMFFRMDGYAWPMTQIY